MEDKFIEQKGIVHNATTLGSIDGQSEDLVNLRFKDGSWRSAGHGEKIYELPDDYEQIYIHTNIYRHVLGVLNGKLWWFADIDTDGNFSNREPVEICSVQGNIQISQTGHLITVIDDNSTYYILFLTEKSNYQLFNTDFNGKQTDTSLLPFVNISFRVTPKVENDEYRYIMFHDGKRLFDSETLDDSARKEEGKAGYLKVRDRLRQENSFVEPFMVCCAAKLYSGDYIFMSNPTLLVPSALSNRHVPIEGITLDSWQFDEPEVECFVGSTEHPKVFMPFTGMSGHGVVDAFEIKRDFGDGVGEYALHPQSKGRIVCLSIDTSNPSAAIKETSMPTLSDFRGTAKASQSLYPVFQNNVFGIMTKLQIKINEDVLSNYKDLVQSLCVFITKESEIFDYADMLISGRSSTDIQKIYDKSGDQYDISVQLSGLRVFPSNRNNSKIIEDLVESLFFKVSEISISEITSGTWKDVKIEEGILSNLEQQEILNIEASDLKSYRPKYSFSYNGRLHIANYVSEMFHGFPLNYFFARQQEGQFEVSYKFATSSIGTDLQSAFDNYNTLVNEIKDLTISYYIKTYIESSEGVSEVVRYTPIKEIGSFVGQTLIVGVGEGVYDLNPIISYPDSRAKSMEIYVTLSYIDAQGTIHKESYLNTFNLTSSLNYNYSYYINPSLKPIKITTKNLDEVKSLPEEKNTTEYFPNGLKVSAVDNPLFFPVETTYQVGSSEIVAMAANTKAVGTGQTGAAPLYVFSKDGLYAMFVDGSGQIAYSSARPIARDVCNNPNVTPIDEGVVFTTDRGIMNIAGENVVEIGQPLEGDFMDFSNSDDISYIKIAANAFSNPKLGNMTQFTDTDFLTFLKDSIVAYNHNERELVVSNPNKDYTFILDRQGNWSRRNHSSDQYINNYPKTYRRKGRDIFDIDKDPTETQNVFLLSRPLKLGNINFKQGHRFVARGFFDTKKTFYYQDLVGGEENENYTSIFDEISINNILFDVKYRLSYKNTGDRDIQLCIGLKREDGQSGAYLKDIFPPSNCKPNEKQTYEFTIPRRYNGYDVSRIYLFVYSGDNDVNVGEWSLESVKLEMIEGHLGVYVFGSFDGRKWAMLGGKEKKGTFSDIGCEVSRVDCRFFMYCLSGYMSTDSRIDFFELTSNGSILGNKIR